MKPLVLFVVVTLGVCAGNLLSTWVTAAATAAAISAETSRQATREQPNRRIVVSRSNVPAYPSKDHPSGRLKGACINGIVHQYRDGTWQPLVVAGERMPCVLEQDGE